MTQPTASDTSKWRPFALWAPVVVAVAILFVRKSWALTNPQLWAEDAVVHLKDVDQWGLHAILIPYRGYLHLAPRLIAWLAARLSDVAYWPAFYNWSTLAVTVVLIARVMSPRFALPHKPWIALAFVLTPHTGEVFLNITNLHWLTDLFVIIQFLMARPTTVKQRVGDYALIVLAGLSDPCAIVCLPLFAWRCWRDRSADDYALLGVVAACAAVQGYFIWRTGVQVDGPIPPFQWLPFFARTGSRLVIWPFLGRHAAQTMPALAQAVISIGALLLLIGWSLRPDELRPVRARLLFAWAVFSLGCIYRIRPDSFASKWHVMLDNLGFAEPYFYASRLLLVWLLITEFSARAASGRWIARLACAAMVMLELPYYRIPAPTDYHWAQNCGAIRTGQKASIPILPDGWVLYYPGRTPAKK